MATRQPKNAATLRHIRFNRSFSSNPRISPEGTGHFSILHFGKMEHPGWTRIYTTVRLAFLGIILYKPTI
jgi:hypothetical protein